MILACKLMPPLLVHTKMIVKTTPDLGHSHLRLRVPSKGTQNPKIPGGTRFTSNENTGSAGPIFKNQTPRCPPQSRVQQAAAAAAGQQRYPLSPSSIVLFINYERRTHGPRATGWMSSSSMELSRAQPNKQTRNLFGSFAPGTAPSTRRAGGGRVTGACARSCSRAGFRVPAACSHGFQFPPPPAPRDGTRTRTASQRWVRSH